MPKRQANRYNHRITFFKAETIVDELGQVIESNDVDVATCWADIKTMLGKEYYAAAAAQAERTYRFIIRCRSDIDRNMKVKYQNRIFDIIEPPINDGEQNITLTILARELQRYTHLVEEEVEVSKKEVADELVTTLKASPNTKKTGRYNKGWRIKKKGNKLIVHNKTDYQLTHLLENGHVKRGGGRVPAKVHIRPAEQRAIENYLEKVEQAIRQ